MGKVAGMRLVTAGQALALTELTADQLREWTIRRRLIKPDEVPNGPGSRAGYSWQTILLLRLAKVLKDKFHLELKAYERVLNALGEQLGKTSFPSLHGKVIAISHASADGFSLVQPDDLRAAGPDVLILGLDSHLAVLSRGFGLGEPPIQLPLFPAIAVR
jgi:hypothetical protein